MTSPARRSSACPAAGARATRCSTTSGSWTGSAHAHETSEWTTSVCTGSLLLGAAGVLDGLDATSHWLELETAGASSARRPTEQRVVEQGKVITAAGVSSGIDMALTLVAKIAGDEFAQDDPAPDRVRPPAAVRRRVAGEGAAGDGRAVAGAGRGARAT